LRETLKGTEVQLILDDVKIRRRDLCTQ